MDISRINLNLLVVLDVLLHEKSTTRAGEKIFLSQPAVTHCLNQLRALFADPLLVRSGQKMILTPKAEQIKPKVNLIIQELKSFLDCPDPFDPSTSEKIFTIAIPDYLELSLVPILMQHLSAVAPKVRIKIRHYELFGDKELFETQSVDIGVGMMRQHGPKVLYEELYKEKMVFLCGPKNPLLNAPVTLDAYLKAKHITRVLDEEMKFSVTEEFLNKKGLSRNSVLFVSNTLPTLYSLEHSPFITTTVSTVATHLDSHLHLFADYVPYDIPPEPIYLLWHEKNDDDPINIWLRAIIHLCIWEIKGIHKEACNDAISKLTYSSSLDFAHQDHAIPKTEMSIAP